MQLILTKPWNSLHWRWTSSDFIVVNVSRPWKQIYDSNNVQFASVADHKYPRQDTIKNLLHLVRFHPQLGQVALSCLVNLGEAIHSSASREEMGILIRGTLGQETLVRNACLQTLQVWLFSPIALFFR